MAEQQGETVPGMAEAIQNRMDELHIGPSRLAREAGITTVGLVPLRKGLRKRYTDATKAGVTAVLRWPSDAIDRLMDGEDPATFTLDGVALPPAVELAIEADPLLDAPSKAALVAFYRAAVAQRT